MSTELLETYREFK